MERYKIEGKIFDLQEKLEICEIALDINEDEELEPAWKDMIKAHKEHIADLEEFLKLLPIQRVSVAKHPLPRPLECWNKARELECGEYIEWHLDKERGNAR